MYGQWKKLSAAFALVDRGNMDIRKQVVSLVFWKALCDVSPSSILGIQNEAKNLVHIKKLQEQWLLS